MRTTRPVQAAAGGGEIGDRASTAGRNPGCARGRWRRIIATEATTMAITVCPVTPGFAAEIGDVDLSRPIVPADLQAIKDAFATYAVLIFPDQHLSQDQHLDFAR